MDFCSGFGDSFLISERQKVGFKRATGRTTRMDQLKGKCGHGGRRLKGKDGDDVEHADESREESERPAGNT